MRARVGIERAAAEVRKDLPPTFCRSFADQCCSPMNFRPDIPKPSRSAALADVADFSLCALQVSPSRLEISFDGKKEAVQPRVMQVLVALAGAQGTVVSRDELIRQCWGGQIVGDDAINRSVAKVREIATSVAPPAFEIETVPRVGYRLIAKGSDSVEKNDAAIKAHPPPSDSAISPLIRSRFTLRHSAITIAAAAIAAIVGGLGIFIWQRYAQPQRWIVARSELIVSSSLRASWPAVSPDGALLAYSAGEDVNDRKIYTRRIYGGPSIQLTHDSYDDSSPSWSPDGSEIAFIAYAKGQPCRLMITAVPGKDSREVARCKTNERSLVAWSKSGKQLYFLDGKSAEVANHVMCLDLSTGDREPFTHSSDASQDDDAFSLSPDGNTLALSRTFEGDRNTVRLLDLKTKRERLLGTADAQYGSGLAWSSDARTLFVTASDGVETRLWSFPADGHRPEQILSTPEILGRLSSSHENLLAVENHTQHFGLARTTPSNSGDLVLLAPEKSFDQSPDISRNGDIIFTSERPDGRGLYLLPKTGEPHMITPLSEQSFLYSLPRWSPDGTRIALGLKEENFTGIRIISRDGATLAAIPLPRRDLGDPEWNSNGHSLIVSGNARDNYRIWRIDLMHGNRLDALPFKGWVDVQSVGDYLYGVRFDAPGVWKIDANPRRLTPGPTSDRASQWRVLGDQIFWVDDRKSDSSSIMVQPISGGPPHLYTTLARYALGPTAEGFAVDSIDGSIVYPSVRSLDEEIELLHLTKQ